jgi:uncharacterized protein
MKRFIIFLLLLVQVFFATTVLAAPTIPPRPAAGSGIYVQDYANVLTAADKQAILSLGQELDSETTAQLAVITIDTLDGQPIEDYALAVLREWGIGTKEKNNGALIVVAVGDRRSRIEVGYGLEGVLPDGLTGRIQDEYMLPYFKEGNYSKGIVQGYNAVAETIADSADLQLTDTQIEAPPQGSSAEQDGSTNFRKLLYAIGIIAFLIFDNLFLGGFFTTLLLLFLSLCFRSGGGGRGGGGFGGGGSFGGGSGGGGGSSRSW